MNDALAHQRFSTGHPDLLNPVSHHKLAKSIQGFKTEQIFFIHPLRMFRHTIAAFEITAVSHRDPQLTFLASKLILKDTVRC